MERDPPDSVKPPGSVPSPSLLPASNRYELLGKLGRGGTAIVHEAVELATGRRVAVKRLLAHPDPHRMLRHAELFEREYHALRQLAHPHIVEVYGYGVDAEGAYYSMELLDGGDLQALAPLPWREVCAVARDICSALSLLHSRRLVHRDLSPRNVRRTHSGLAKLIDFGALAPFGPCKIVVGTPPCCPPESVHLQSLDGRTDLFSLGATLYYALVGHHAYAAPHLSLLGEAWRAGFARVSELVPDIPEALDALLVDLLHLEADARPANAAEVLQRLSAIDGVALVEARGIARAYLSLPTLVARDGQLAQVRRKLKVSMRTRGRTIAIEGAAGVGRTRFLEACMLDATLRAAVCVRADADDAASGDYGVLRALLRRLLGLLPVSMVEAATPRREVLAHLLPELIDARAAEQTPAQVPESQALRMQLQVAVQDWLKNLSQSVSLVFAVDDVHRVDEPSAALLSLLAHAGLESVHFLVTTDSSAPWVSAAAQQMLLSDALRVVLAPLSPAGTASLLQSLFGDVPNVDTLSHRLYALTSGNPRDLMALAQHLVDRGIVQYAAGAWTLPEQLDAFEMPTSMTQALCARVDALREPARVLAAALALCPDLGFSRESCAKLLGPLAPVVRVSLDALLKAEIVRPIDAGFALAKPSWIGPVRATLAPELERELHARLASVLLAQGQSFRAGQHLLRAGELSRALDVLVAHARSSQEETAQSQEAFVRYARSLPTDWFETFDEAINACTDLSRPALDAFLLRGRLAGIVPAFGVSDRGHISMLLEQLEQLSGLRDWQTLDPQLDAKTRIEQAQAQALARHQASDAHERLLEPVAAVRLLARVVSSAVSRVAVGLDVAYLRALPGLAPLAPVSPALAVLQLLVEGMDARYTGRTGRARVLYQQVLERTRQPDGAGMDASYREIIRLGVMNALGTTEACMGLSSSLDWAERTATHPAYQLNAVQTRLLHLLYQGDVRAADTCRKQVETLRLQSLQLYEGSHLCWEIGAHAIAEDLTRMRHAIERVTPLAQRYEAWRAVQHYAAAEYHRIRRDTVRALAAVEHALTLVAAGLHPLWAQIASTHVRVLYDLGQYPEALALAEYYIGVARQAELDYAADQLWMALSLCQARADRAQAEQTADAVIARMHKLGSRGLLLGLAHETRARVAQLSGNDPGYAHHAELCRREYCAHNHPGLLAKCRRLFPDSKPPPGPLPAHLAQTPDSYAHYTSMRLVAALEHCKGMEQRAKLAVTILARQTASKGGFMFTLTSDGLECIASVGELSLPPVIAERVLAYFELHAKGAQTTMTSSRPPERSERGEWRDETGQLYRPVLLSHDIAGSQAVTGVVLLALSAGASAFRYPGQIANAISRFWADCDDTSMLLLD